MDRLAQQSFGSGPIPTVSASLANPGGHSWSMKSRVRFLQETALIIGMQLLFRAALLLRRWNY